MFVAHKGRRYILQQASSRWTSASCSVVAARAPRDYNALTSVDCELRTPSTRRIHAEEHCLHTYGASSGNGSASCHRPAALHLAIRWQYLKGVGPRRAEVFARLGIRTVGDLIEHFPFRHERIPKSVPIDALVLDETATVVGELRRIRVRGRYGQQRIAAQVVDGTGVCRVTWFNSAYLVDRLKEGQVVRLTGKVDLRDDLAALTNPQTTIIDERQVEDALDDGDSHKPVYPASAELPAKLIAQVVGRTLTLVADQIVDFLPEGVRKRRELPPRKTAILRYHQPINPDDVAIARRRLAYDELLLCQLAVQLARRRQQEGPAADPFKTSEEIDRRIRARFPFTLTPGQERAASEIASDLRRTRPMNRLLQADVGAGKTAVAVYAALAVIAHRQQVAILAPTEVLATQHQRKIERYLKGSRVRTGFLTGSTKQVDRTGLLGELAAGRIDLLVGTHAVIEQDVEFHRLGLVVIDEQHKFGVSQRAALRGKGRAPHCLVLTATPIPRTLAMTVFGELDVSTIDGAPPGRQPVTTRLVPDRDTSKAWGFVRAHLDAGEQAYIVYPLVEESETLPLKAAGAEVKRLGATVLAGYRLGLLHGRLRPAEKADVMERFATARCKCSWRRRSLRSASTCRTPR